MKTLWSIAKKSVLPLLAIAGAAYAIHYSLWAKNAVPANSQATQVRTSASSTTTGTVLAGPGLVEAAGRTVEIAPPLPGLVESVISEDRVGTIVKKGEELLRLDRKQLEAELDVKMAQLASAQASLNQLKSMPRAEDLAPLVAKGREAKVAVTNAKSEWDRAIKAGVGVTDADRVQKENAYATAQAQFEYAEAEWRRVKAGAWKPEIQVAEAAVKLAQSQVAQTRVELDRLTVHCQSDLTLLSVDVRPQEYVGIPPGKAIIGLGDLSKSHVRVYIDEHDASRVVDGAKATAHLQHGQEYLQIPLVHVRSEPVVVPKPTLTGEQTERVDVRVLQVIYGFENPDDQKKVRVGQQLDVFINEK
jgi:HlyD family secretion protein